MTATLYAALRAEQIALAPARATMPLVRIGMGAHRAPDTTRPALLAGVAGALDERLRPGDLVVADEVRTLDAGSGGTGVPVPSAPLLASALRRCGLTVHLGPIVTGSGLTRLASTDAGGALAVDMESATLAHQLRAADPQMPFAVVRAVVDTPTEPLARPSTPLRGLRALRALRTAVPALAQWSQATGARRLRLAAPRSFCAGVSRAIDTVERALDRFGPPVYVRRQIVHNTHVVQRLETLGAVFVEEIGDIPAGATAVLAAHGVAPTVRIAAAQKRLRLIDATCPLVAKVHTEIRRHTRRGHTVFLIGHADHEETQGSLGQAPENVMVVEDVAAARRVQPPDPDRVAYAMQTTLAVEDAEHIAEALRERFPALTAPPTDDICYATTNRQHALRAVAADSDLVLVVGSNNSSNSQRLAEVSERRGVPAHLIEDTGELDLRWLAGASHVGITAGASAPAHLVEEVVAALCGLGPTQIEETRLAEEDIQFALPKEVL